MTRQLSCILASVLPLFPSVQAFLPHTLQNVGITRASVLAPSETPRSHPGVLRMETGVNVEEPPLAPSGYPYWPVFSVDATAEALRVRLGGQERELPQLVKVQGNETASFPPRRYSTWTWTHTGEPAYATSGGRKSYSINYRVEGREGDRPLLLIHGFGASVNHYKYNIETIAAAGYRVYAIDLLGFGASDKPEDIKICLELWRDQIRDFIETMSKTHKDPEKRWVIAGNSIGGLLTLMTADALGDRMAAGVMFNASGGLTSVRDSELNWWQKGIWWFFRTVILSDFLGNLFFERTRNPENLRSTLALLYGDKGSVTEELANILLQPADDKGALTVFLKTFRAEAGPSPEEILPRLPPSLPLLAIWGDEDPWTPFDKGSRFPSLNPSVEISLFPKTGHCPHDDRPAAVNKALLEWLDRKGLPFNDPREAVSEGGSEVGREGEVVSSNAPSESGAR
uniref:AB hydrolase-1 domain-containing protein n=1 Tax=Chromera velia CCMP2878 TaxID=1169474 RepID=A0A0G4HA88_9ALVE|eukprot:Cvel_25609.t1-p1 / transcript=Cvel_25609.t1 / gene=Cvel_25609 / organism=Chromera_velia_CCMP2878 / gene_product=none 2-hydroxy-6-oxononadienedioate/2-hydroxy-6-, putative / transcript_product=none 2-hydroxy-6-oxononadienedioate/2-hydroxy-6-, putative / location=Cvel_scaffold2924:9947-13037(+) / protein_length=454 / sequence_SO=supercontig / SO=protein_coding / is_pseudo=false